MSATVMDNDSMYSIFDSTRRMVRILNEPPLAYFVDPAWKNHTFGFTIKFQNDALAQKGIEKIAELGIDRIITEKYIRVKSN